MSIWDASNDHASTAGCKIQLSLHQQAGNGTSLAIGASADKPLYSMEKALPQSPSQKGKQAKHVAVAKHSPSGGAPVPVAQLALPERTPFDADIVSIYPQAAAIHAIEAIANSPAAAEIATFDPTAKSPEAARLAQDAVAQAHRHYGCELMHATKKRDSLGAMTATYSLDHPAVGRFTITVTRSSAKQSSSQEPQAKISLHHPSATPAAVAAETLVLAFLDFGREACVLDVPGLLALNSRYIIDTSIAALLAVTAIENDAVAAETITFAPPPKSPYAEKKARKSRSSEGSESRKWYKRSSRAIDQVQKELVGHPADVAAPVEAAVALIGFTLKTAVFVLEAGVKVTAKLVGHLASKV